jgi:hypothetical protein
LRDEIAELRALVEELLQKEGSGKGVTNGEGGTNGK